jgi:lysophospholipase L1-like esterase
MAERVARGRLAVVLALGISAIALLDLGLGAIGAVPPDDPLLFFRRTHEQRIDPFVEGPAGVLQIRPDWVNDGEGLRGRRGRRAGRQFLLPGFRPLRISREKLPGVVRVVALGGSTTYGLYVGADAAFPAQLGARLSERLAGRRVEVVNLGCPGFASDRVVALLPAALELDPDLVVIYAGHNELLGGGVGDLSPALAVRAALLRHSTLFAWWNHLLAGWLRSAESEAVREEVAAIEAGEIPTFVPEEAPPTAWRSRSGQARAASAERYAANLREILDRLERAAVPGLFAVPVANLRVPPLTGPQEDPEAERAIREALRAARAMVEARRYEAAATRLAEVDRRFPGHAGVLHARGMALLSSGREDEAREVLRRAVDADVRTHRIDSAHEAALRRVLEDAGVAVVELSPALQADLDPEPATQWFVDHVHPTATGHARIADALLPEASALLRP